MQPPVGRTANAYSECHRGSSCQGNASHSESSQCRACDCPGHSADQGFFSNGVSDFDREEKIKAVTNIYNKLGIDKLAEAKIKECFDESRKYLDGISVADERKQVLRGYTGNMMNRKK